MAGKGKEKTNQKAKGKRQKLKAKNGGWEDLWASDRRITGVGAG
jgi:hypothetical protein